MAEVGNTQSISNNSSQTTAEEASSASASASASPAARNAAHPNQNDENDDDASDTDTTNSAIPEPIRELLPATLSRLTAGLPMHELDIIIKEATACEDALEREIEILERELGIHNPHSKKSNDQKQNNKEPSTTTTTTTNNNASSSPLKEPTMISIPLLPMPYQPGGQPGGKGHINYLESVDAMLHTEFAPPDRYFTVSALLGRLRDPMKLPYPPNSRLGSTIASSSTAASSSRTTTTTTTTTIGGGKKQQQQHESVQQQQQQPTEVEKKKKRLALEKQKALLALDESEMYHREHGDTKELLALYKKISSHRTAVVFRKPVNPAEAPGYKERILFPMDLSLIRKMIVARMITSFSSLHQRIGLICHNCVKFNGRESDYAVLTREFEDFVDDKVLEALKNAAKSASAASAAAVAPH